MLNLLCVFSTKQSRVDLTLKILTERLESHETISKACLPSAKTISKDYHGCLMSILTNIYLFLIGGIDGSLLDESGF